ncbi:MAG TPA: UDP-N-acetylmuramoyl-tripeptide--D-alanyl-D-alanine ligase [Candidatus Ruania gallistercoris]|uniref:UDP-N-acetylmuramoyl-tripeptide--D-alanyl-D-alanine ligase n=1 Tax=Candidatus Ruania gallistercoris TaxID=2838746 RepID=A0A9D2EIS3_9MICO|nr:UDP-N-acetylmuramoyl-tripeptide--D-alanyl-D-alanine ligase [Candidatus Ruania gallistercoris]
MIALDLTEIASAVGAPLPAAGPDVPVLTGPVVVDSRQAEPGSLFAAIDGAHVDGHDFLEAAAANGARAALVTRPVPGAPIPTLLVPDVPAALGDLAREVLARLRERTGIRVVAITGSVGKTTTKDLLAQLLAGCGEVIAPVGSFNNEIGLPLTVLRAEESTRVLVLEMGADAPGNLTYLTAIAPPDVAVVLMVGRAHLGGFGSLENVATAKAELVQGLTADGIAVLNADDPRVAAMAAVAAGRDVLEFGTGAAAQVRAEEVRTDASGRLELTLVAPQGSAPVRTALVGRHQVSNVLAAAATALALGMSVTEVAAAAADARVLSPHRMQVSRTGAVTVVDDSYNANPDSMRAALRALPLVAAGRRSVAVLGEMLELGATSAAEHAEIGAECARTGVQVVVTVGAGAEPIAEGARAAGADSVHSTANLEEAEQLLATLITEGDVVLVKSSNGAGLMRLAERLAAGEVQGAGQ